MTALNSVGRAEAFDYITDTMFDAPLFVTRGTAAEVAAQVLAIRDHVVALVESGGVRAIDYESAAEIKGQNGPNNHTPPGLWAVECKRDLDVILTDVYNALGTGPIARRRWASWLMHRRVDTPWVLANIAHVYGVSESTTHADVSLVDQLLSDQLERRDWRIL
jgi:hypothetical protein